jgi:adenylyltransferase/sulfurtransferase
MSRYSRQELFPHIGPEGQARIRASRVLLVGCGALGTHLAEFCVRAGVGALAIVDRDIVEESNLQRQSLFTEDDAAQAMPKAEAARRALARVNSEVAITAHVDDFTFRNAERLGSFPTLHFRCLLVGFRKSSKAHLGFTSSSAPSDLSAR